MLRVPPHLPSDDPWHGPPITPPAPSVTAYVYDGDRVLEEYDGASGLQRRYVYGPNLDEPLAMQTPHQLEHALGRHPTFECTLRRELVGQPVRQRIRERNAELQDIHSGSNERPTRLDRGVEIRITGTEVRDERSAILAPGTGESGGEAGHGTERLATNHRK